MNMKLIGFFLFMYLVVIIGYIITLKIMPKDDDMFKWELIPQSILSLILMFIPIGGMVSLTIGVFYATLDLSGILKIIIIDLYVIFNIYGAYKIRKYIRK